MAARSRRRGDAAQNLDSLLDTMANFTGILVVLLAVSQISVGDAMARLRERLLDRPELSREALDAAEVEAEELRAALAPLASEEDALREARQQGRSELSELTARIARLDAELRDARGAPLDAKKLRARVDAARGRVQALERAIAEEQAALAALQKEIASLPARPPVQDLRVPLQRPTPPGAREVTFLARYGRLLQIDAREAVGKLRQGAMRATGGFTPTSLRTSRTQQLQVMAWFERNEVTSGPLRWRVVPGPAGHLFAEAVWKPAAGETAEEIESGRYRAELLRLRGENVYLHFFVWEDGFDVYRKARAMADEAGYAAGWAAMPPGEPLVASLTNAPSAARSID